MKYLGSMFVMILFGIGICKAQVSPHAIGIRLGGDGDIHGAEFSYQHGFGTSNRLEMDAGFGHGGGHDRIYAAGIYHWVWNIAGGFNWYTGPGAMVGFYSHHHHDNGNGNGHDHDDDYMNIGIGGQIGLEYNFNHLNAPILVSIDIRPMWDFVGHDHGVGWGAALGVRYTW